jgi:cysteine sulfinate desulfinase/cysteine desulfurase-like protein
LQAMAVDEERLMGQVRFVLGKSNTKAQVDAFLYQLGQVIQRNRVF